MKYALLTDLCHRILHFKSDLGIVLDSTRMAEDPKTKDYTDPDDRQRISAAYYHIEQARQLLDKVWANHTSVRANYSDEPKEFPLED